MGGFCSRSSAVHKSPSERIHQTVGQESHDPMPKAQSTLASPPTAETMEKRLPEQKQSQVASEKSESSNSKTAASAKTGTTKVSEVSSLLGKAGTAGLGKAVEVLDTLGSSMTSLSVNDGFVPGASLKGNIILILAFEIANTIVKGANLMQSLSREKIKHLKEVVLHSEGVQNLISRDMDELLRITAADKREELKIFSKEVIRFGNRCKDPQWHNLDRYFAKLGTEFAPPKQLKEDAEGMMQQLLPLVQSTAELYHELHALDRFEQDYQRKHQEEENFNSAQRGDHLQFLRQELKSQRKRVKSLKKKSLWFKNLEEVMEKLVEIVHFLYLEIDDVFGSADGGKPARESFNGNQRLGSAGLALHYANIIILIDTIVSRSPSVPATTRETLYRGLPPRVKCTLRSKLQSFQVKEELTIPEIKAEIEKTSQWLVLMANNTTKVHHGFGWVGEWANAGTEGNQNPAELTDLIRIETLHHANKEKTETYILDLVVWLHHLISHSREGSEDFRPTIKSPTSSPTEKDLVASQPMRACSNPSSMLTQEDHEMLRDISFRKLTPGISKSQEFESGDLRLSEHIRLNKSNSHSLTTEGKNTFFPLRRPSIIVVPFNDFDVNRMKALDVIDDI